MPARTAVFQGRETWVVGVVIDTALLIRSQELKRISSD